VTEAPRAHAAAAVTWLFVPGDRADRFAKAAGSGADAVILDLEDAVAEADKGRARRSVAEWIGAGNPAYVRINAQGTEHHEADLEALTGLGPGLRGVMVPKAEVPGPFERLDRRLPAAAVVVALVESAAGVGDAYAIASAPRVARLAFGAADLMLETGIEDQRTGLLLARSTLVLASRAAGLEAPIDGITTALDDPTIAQDDAEYGRGIGFAGKLCLHPRQVVPVLRGFRPSERDAAWARSVLDGAAGADGRAMNVDGEMIDRPLLQRAEHVWNRHRTIERRLEQLAAS
jgi:citrate lyase subunit beta / citryl-CoA lyase